MAEITGVPDLTFLDHAKEPNAFHTFVRDFGDTRWKVNNSSIYDYSRRANLFGNPDGLVNFITEQIGFFEGNVGLDIAAGTTGSALRSLLASRVLHSALATNYESREPEAAKRELAFGLHHIGGNLVQREVWEKILDWKRLNAPEGLALAMHRPVGGLQSMPHEAYKGAAHLVLDMVRPGGLMFTQVPRGLVSNIPDRLGEICQSIERRPDVVEVITSKQQEDIVGRPDLYAVILK